MASVNAQEFMVQLAVQTDKSPTIIAKLAMGVSERLGGLSKQLKGGLGGEQYMAVCQDLKWYLSKRSVLYRAISLKYYGKMVAAQELRQGALNLRTHFVYIYIYIVCDIQETWRMFGIF